MKVLDEKSYAEKLIKDGPESGYPELGDLAILAKYYKYINYETHDIRKELEKYCLKVYPEYNFDTSYWKINKALNIIKHYRLRISFPIVITKKEIDSIKQFENQNYQKITFILIVLAKISKYSNTTIKIENKPQVINEFYVNNNLGEVTKFAKLSMGKKDIDIMSHVLYLGGILDGTEYFTLKIKCINEDEDREPGIIVDDWNNFIVSWQRYLGQKIAACSLCGKLFVKRTNRHAMCRSCSEKQRRDKHLIVKRNWWRDNRAKK